MKRLKLFILLVFLFLFINSASNLHGQTFKTFAKEFMETAFTDLGTFKTYCNTKIYTTDCDNGEKIKISLKKAYNELKPTISNAKYKVDSKKNTILIYIDDFYKYDEGIEFKLVNGEWKLHYYYFPC